MPLPEWLTPLEIFKPLAQALAVAAGVFFGWRLNGQSQRRDRINEARATWAGAAEECLTAWDTDHRSFVRHQAGLDESSERMERLWVLEDKKAQLRVATMHLVLLDPPHSDDPLAIEAAVLGIEQASSIPPLHVHVRAVRVRLRRVVERWTGRKVPALTAKESGQPGTPAHPLPDV